MRPGKPFSETGGTGFADGKSPFALVVQKPFQEMGVSENSGTPKSSILIGFSIISHPFWGIPVYLFLETPKCLRKLWINQKDTQVDFRVR